MKIIECSDSFLPIVDGVGRVVQAYAETLAHRNNEVYVVTPSDDTGYRGGLAYELLDYTSIRVSKRLPWKIGLEQLDSHFQERIKFVNPQIIHVHSPGFAGFLGLLLAKKKHVPVVGSFHSKYYDDILKITHSKALARISSNIIADFYEKCDEVWAVSENAGDTLKSYGYKGQVVIMPNGTVRRALHSEMVDDVAKQYGINKDGVVFLFVGQLNWKKNIKRILESCALLKKKGLNFQLVLAGQGPDRKEIEREGKKLGIGNEMIFTGHLSDSSVLDCLYHIATLFLFPSIYDNAPMVLREAACMKTPGLLIRGSSSAEVIKDMENGLLCNDDNEDFCQVVMKFLNLAKEDRQKIGENAFNTIPIPWDGELMDRIESRYQTIIDKYNSENKKR